MQSKLLKFRGLQFLFLRVVLFAVERIDLLQRRYVVFRFSTFPEQTPAKYILVHFVKVFLNPKITLMKHESHLTKVSPQTRTRFSHALYKNGSCEITQ